MPLFLGFQLTRRVTKTSSLGYAGSLMLGVLVSFVILAAALVCCVLFAREQALPFTFGVAGALIVSAIVFGFVKTFGNKKG
ncbi:MAG: hypothetical protein FWE65_02405 [Eggerthellaceae bacterium]|nr:hypothetical protein [Eggerthellaceae bacterium]